MLATQLEVLYIDNHILAAVKPCGIPTQKDPHAEISLEEVAKDWIKEEYNKPGNVFLHPIHRLDKPVAGIVLFARTSKALSRMNEQMRERVIKKTYEAITDGYPPAKSATLEHFLVHEEHHAKVVSSKHKEAKQAILHYQLISKKDNYAHLQIELETGRYHQIRAQLSAIGCPILGDRKYGSSQTYSKQGIALAHVRMEFMHPVSQEAIDLSYPIPFAL